MLSSHTKVLISLLNQALVSQPSYEHIHIKSVIVATLDWSSSSRVPYFTNEEQTMILEKHKKQQQFADILEKTENI